MENYVFKLPSGVECEISELYGKHQRLLTEDNKVSHQDKLNEVLRDIVVRIGSNTTISKEFIGKLLAGDKKAILVTVRQFTLDFLPEFIFNFKYINSDGEKKFEPIVINTGDGNFNTHKMMVEKDSKLIEANFTDYEEVIEHKKVTLILPKSKKEVQFTMLDGLGEKIGSATPKNKISTHTPIYMRQPVEFFGDNHTPMKLNLDKLPYKDIEFLRKSIKDREPEVDTVVMFEHPDTGKMVERDILGMVAFFFPSEAI